MKGCDLKAATCDRQRLHGRRRAYAQLQPPRQKHAPAVLMAGQGRGEQLIVCDQQPQPSTLPTSNRSSCSSEPCTSPSKRKDVTCRNKDESKGDCRNRKAEAVHPPYQRGAGTMQQGARPGPQERHADSSQHQREQVNVAGMPAS